MTDHPDAPVDYQRLHICAECETRVALRVFPNSVGWLVGTGCNCRNKDGGPRRYSTEITRPFPTFQLAEEAREEMAQGIRLPTEPRAPFSTTQNVNWHKPSNKWIVQFKRNRKQYTVGYFHDHSEAVKARDEWLEAA